MYGLIVPPGVSPEVAEALEGTHGNPAIDELQTRMALREHLGSHSTTGIPTFGSKTMRDSYVVGGRKTRWARLGEEHGRQ